MSAAVHHIAHHTPRSPQLENGFIRIANELFDAILAGPMTSQEMSVLLSIVRKTYGYGKKEDDVSASQLGKLCNMSRPHVTEALNSLARKNIINKKPGVHGSIISIQKDYSQWREDPLKGMKRTPHADLEGYHYTYRVTHEATGEFYLGVRTCKCQPTQDRYIGSGRWPAETNKKHLIKAIEGQYATREEAHAAEQALIHAEAGNPLMKNLILFKAASSPRTESEQGVQNLILTSSEPVQGASSEPVHTIDNVSINNQKKARSEKKISLRTFLEACKAENKKPIPESDPVFQYADEVGIPLDFIRFAWVEFKRKYTAPRAKTYIDWNQHFQNAVRENWYHIWYLKDDAYQLTTRGLQIQKEIKETA